MSEDYVSASMQMTTILRDCPGCGKITRIIFPSYSQDSTPEGLISCENCKCCLQFIIEVTVNKLGDVQKKEVR